VEGFSHHNCLCLSSSICLAVLYINLPSYGFEKGAKAKNNFTLIETNRPAENLKDLILEISF
jgi:hypothetical protein